MPAVTQAAADYPILGNTRRRSRHHSRSAAQANPYMYRIPSPYRYPLSLSNHHSPHLKKLDYIFAHAPYNCFLVVLQTVSITLSALVQIVTGAGLQNEVYVET